MTQPTRWLDDENTSREIRELVRAGSRPPRFPQVALAAAIVPLAQKAAMASVWSLPATAVVAIKATTVGLAVGLGSIAAVTVVSGPKHHQPATVREVPRERAVATAVVPNLLPLEVPKELDAVPAPDEPRMSGTGVTVAQPTGIAAEARLLERARALLDESPSRALMLTEEHRSHVVGGQMIAERELIAIDALLRLGRKGEAERRAQPLLADRGSQVFAQRVRNLLDRHGR